MRYFVLLFVCFFVGCNVKNYSTSEGGYRLYNPTNFELSKPKYRLFNKTLIDTNCIYLMDSTYNKWDEVKIKKESYRFLRFFSGGQVLFIYNKGLPSLEMINNRNIGMPGYYYIKGRDIKINLFNNINGGVIVDYSGEIRKDGNLIFYEQVSKKIFPLKIKEYERKSYWSKIKIEKIESYNPDW